jgi:hypothetical protein
MTLYSRRHNFEQLFVIFMNAMGISFGVFSIKSPVVIEIL